MGGLGVYCSNRRILRLKGGTGPKGVETSYHLCLSEVKAVHWPLPANQDKNSGYDEERMKMSAGRNYDVS